MRSFLVLRQQGKIRPKLVSVKRSERGERSEDLLFERSEFQIFSELRERSSEAGSALNFWLLFFQEKSNNPIFAANKHFKAKRKMKGLGVALLASLLLAMGCQEAPKGYVIKGEVADMPTGKVFLKVFRNKMFFDVDTAEVKEGKFTFEGTVEQPLLYGLATEEMDYPAQLFLENVPMEVSMTKEGESLSVKGSAVNDLFLGNAEKVFAPGFSIDSLVSQYPDNPAAAFYLYRYFTYQLPLDQLKATRAKLAPALASSPYVQDLDAIIARLEKVQIGQVAPDFSLPDTAGVSVSLADFRGKYVLLDFWASWCPPCRRENPNVVKAYEENKDKNFTIIGISLDNNREKWLKGIADDHLTWTHLSDLKYWDSEIPALYGVRAIPSNMLLDPNGVIIAKDIREEALHETLREVLK